MKILFRKLMERSWYKVWLIANTSVSKETRSQVESQLAEEILSQVADQIWNMLDREVLS